jgi:hypothetical protein
MTKRKWFEVDVEGLRELQEGKPKHFVARELIQNAFDEDVTFCAVETSWHEGLATITVKDNSPEGFRNLADAFTLFGNTYKRADATKRGRFNLGEKQALALCESAFISTTKGTVVFTKDGRTTKSEKTDKGSTITLSIKVKKEDYEELLSVIKTYLPPDSVLYTVNGQTIPYKEPYRVTEAVLPTELEQDGALRPTKRKTAIHIFKATGQAHIFELGIPICEIDCTYDIDIQQKVPLSPDRENVTQAYLAQVYAHILNVTADELTEEGVGNVWTRQAVENPNVEPETVKNWVTKLYGDKVVVANVKDRRSIDDAIAHGYKVVYAKELSKGIWDNIKKVDGLMPSSTALFGSTIVKAEVFEPDANMLAVAKLAKTIAHECFSIDINVRFVSSKEATTLAQYGDRTLTFNVGRLGVAWFKPRVDASIIDLIVHELGHEYGLHTEISYQDAITKLAGRLTILALEKPELFDL